MDEYKEDVMVWPTMKELLACAEAELQAAKRPAGKSTIQYGSDVPALDMGDECDGFLWVRMVDAYPSSSFPDQSTALNRNGVRMAMAFQLEVAVARCVRVTGTIADEAGTMFRDAQPIPPEVIFEDARAQFADMAALRRSICKCLSGQPFVLGNFASAVPTGMVNYIAWAVTVYWDPEDV